MAEYDSLTGNLKSFGEPKGPIFGCFLSAKDYLSIFQIGNSFSRSCNVDTGSLELVSPTY